MKDFCNCVFAKTCKNGALQCEILKKVYCMHENEQCAWWKSDVEYEKKFIKREFIGIQKRGEKSAEKIH